MTRWFYAIALFFAITAMMVGCFVSTDHFGTGGAGASGGGTGAAGGGGSGACSPLDCDDKNPCTNDQCIKGACAHDPKVGEPCGAMMMLTCNAQGKCEGCTGEGDCPADTACKTYMCDVNQVCIETDLPSDTMLPDTMAGDCQKPVCDGTGNVKSMFEPIDVPMDDGNDCIAQECDFTSMGPMSTPKLVGTACMTNSGQVCNGTGVCVECMMNSNCGSGGTCSAQHTCGKCDDNTQNGNEIGIDCGGDCPKKCNGEACSVGSDCKSGFCTDGVCCDKACDGICEACDVGKLGTCTHIPKGTREILFNFNGCNGNNACNGNGGCVALNGKNANGELCSDDNECLSNRCRAGLCRLPINNPCSDDVQCGSLRCLNNVCTPCSADADCASNQCDTTATPVRCKAKNGTPCGADTDCASGSCDQSGTHLCGVGVNSMCSVPADCINYHCVGGTCSMCSTGIDPTCPANVCNSGTCLLPQDAYCIDNTDCASLMCSAGFPKKCF